jgi:serine protease AprX
MSIAYGTTWSDNRKGRLVILALGVAVLVAVSSTPNPEVAENVSRLVSVIVREEPGAGDAAERQIQYAGGTVQRHIGIIHGFVARVPEGSITSLSRAPGIHSITLNRRVHLQSSGFDAKHEAGSMYNVARAINADHLWKKGYTGSGVGVALIDSGVVPVPGLTVPGKVVNGADLSFESPADNLRHLDTYGHGTHMAGIIAGRDSSVASGDEKKAKGEFVGVAPGAHILNVKIANAQGATDVSQVLAAIDWVVQHRNDNGMNIRVLNLSFGTDGVQDYRVDPLTYAAEVAWRRGIVVVVAAGNSQFGTSKLNNPAYDPYVIAVGAADTRGTQSVSDDVVPSWSAHGDASRRVDMVAPGQSLVSLRDPGSNLDMTHPGARMGDRFFRGSGTSQAAAVVSGAAALLVQQRPGITPDQVKALLMDTAAPLPSADPSAQGAGLIDMKAARDAATPAASQSHELSTGTGSLEAARGTVHVVDPNGVELRGEQDIFGAPWEGNSWSGNSWSGNSWSGGTWNGNSWSGNSWSGNSWSGNSWSGNSWSGNSWSGNSWSGNSWSGNSWSGNSWSGNSWSGNSWSGNSWSGNSWSGNSWSGNSWSGNSWS